MLLFIKKHRFDPHRKFRNDKMCFADQVLKYVMEMAVSTHDNRQELRALEHEKKSVYLRTRLEMFIQMNPKFDRQKLAEAKAQCLIQRAKFN